MMNVRKYLQPVCMCLILLLGASCTEQLEDSMTTDGGAVVKAVLSEYHTDKGEASVDGENTVNDMQACLFENGVLAKVYPDLQDAGSGYAIKLDRMSGTLYMLANAGGWLDLRQLQASGITEKEWLATTVPAQDGRVRHFFTGTLKLDGQPGGQVLSLNMKRGVARFDLHIRGMNVAVKSVTLKNIAQEGFLMEQTEVLSPVGADKDDCVIGFSRPVESDSLGIAYVYEQAGTDLKVSVEASIGGRDYTLEESLPGQLKRNAVYTLTVRKDAVTQDVKLEVEAWEDGGDSPLLPDLEGRITIDREKSDLPEGAQIAGNGDELILPSAPADFIMALDCDDELELVSVSSSSVSVEAAGCDGGGSGSNLFRVRKQLPPPNYPVEKVTVQFRHKSLQGVYEEDQLILTLQANPIRLEGSLQFGRDDFTCDFGRYVDNELGRFIMPEGYEVVPRFDGEDEWLKVELAEGQGNTYRIVGGWRPNDPKADGRVQAARLVVRKTGSGEETEEYVVKRRNFGMPVTLMNGVWWCKYNAMGNSKDFSDQILVPDDPAAKRGQTVLEYLNGCTTEEYMRLWNNSSYIGDSGIALEGVDDGGVLKLKGYNQNPPVNMGQLDPKLLSPDGYEMPPVEYYDRIFNGDGYMRFDTSGGPYAVQSPWEGNREVFTATGRREDLTVGSVKLPTIYHVEVYDKMQGVKQESVTFYGPGAQWNNNGINHNKVVIACYSPSNLGWFHYFTGYGMYRQVNGKNNTRIVRFIKSPVEYMY